ncbi:CsbD family protein [Sorangium sp. So ce363]|uniref:CsbD family protein n=2 Tax=unclassified Sorangium TaxID=2621164 RepID=UPI003F60C86D
MAHRLLDLEVANARSTAAVRRREALRRPRHEEHAMSNASDRNEGAAEEMGGKIKKGLGQLLGDEQMEAEGRAKELRGKVQKEDAKAEERAKGAVEEAAGAIKNRVGKLVDNEQMAAEGKAKELKGENRQKANQ